MTAHDQTPKPLTIAQAAARLNTTSEAVRMRIKRGTLEGYRDNRGRWAVLLADGLGDDAEQPTEPVQANAQTPASTDDRTADLEEKIIELETQLAEEILRRESVEDLLASLRVELVEQTALASERRAELDRLHGTLKTVLDQPPSILSSIRRWVHRKLVADHADEA